MYSSAKALRLEIKNIRLAIREYRQTAKHLAEQRANADKDDPETPQACREWLEREMHCTHGANRLEDLILRRQNEIADLKLAKG